MSIGSASGFYVTAGTLLGLLLPRARHVFELEHVDGVCHPWQFVLHTYCHLLNLAALPGLVGTVGAMFMVIPLSLPVKALAQAALISLLSQGWIISFIIFLICIAPTRAYRVSTVATMTVTVFQGYIVPRPALPIFIRWVTLINPIFWSFSGLSHTLLKDRVLPCEKDSSLECAEKEFNRLLVRLGLEIVDPMVACAILMGFTWLVLMLAVAVFAPWKWYKENLKERLFGNGKCFFLVPPSISKIYVALSLQLSLSLSLSLSVSFTPLSQF